MYAEILVTISISLTVLCAQAKDLICHKIDNYIRDRIIIADQVIQDTAGQKIKDGDVILTFARWGFSDIFLSVTSADPSIALQ